MVDVVDGPLKGRSGAVRYIMRGFVFVQTREVADNAGFICLQARHTKVRCVCCVVLCSALMCCAALFAAVVCLCGAVER